MVVAGQAPRAKTWINGDYRVPFGPNCPILNNVMAVVHVDDGGATFRQLRFLDSESQAYQPMSWVRGEANNTVMITLNGETAVAVVSEDKKRLAGGLGLLAASGCPMVWITPGREGGGNQQLAEGAGLPRMFE